MLFPPALVVAMSVGGYLSAEDIHQAWFLPLIGAGVGTTIAVAISRRRDVWVAIRINGLRVTGLLCIGLVAAALVVPRQIAENKPGYLEFMNGEFLFYSMEAAFSKGIQHSPLPVTWERSVQECRDGIDFLNVFVSDLLGFHPVHIVQLTSAFLRIGSVVLCSLVIWEFGARARFARATSIVLIAAVVLSPLDIYAFQTSFMAANASMGMFILMLTAVVIADKIPPALFVSLLTLGNIYLLVTYPEIMPFLAIAEAALFLERCLKPSRFLWMLPLGNVLPVAINYKLVLRKIRFVYDQVHGHNGWSILSDPLTLTGQYAKHLLGMEYNFIPSPVPIPPTIVLATSLMAVAACIWGLRRLELHIGTRTVWLLPLGFLWLQLEPLFLPPPAGTPMHFYGAAKYVLMWAWVVPVAFAVAIPSIPSKVAKVLLLSCVSLHLVIGTAVLFHAMVFQVRMPTFYSSSLARRLTRAVVDSHHPAVVLGAEPVSVLYWYQVLDSAGQAPVLVSQDQANIVARSTAAPFAAPDFSGLETRSLAAIRPLNHVWISDYHVIVQQDFPEAFSKKLHIPMTGDGPTLFHATNVEVREENIAPRAAER